MIDKETKKYNGGEVRRLRKRLKLTQKKLSEELGVSVHTIRKWEKPDELNNYKSINKEKINIKLYSLEEQIPNLESEKNEEIVKSDFTQYFRNNVIKLNPEFDNHLFALWDIAIISTIRNKIIAIGTLLYFVNPIDAIPDITPLFGFTDDAAIALTAINFLKKDSSEKSK